MSDTYTHPRYVARCTGGTEMTDDKFQGIIDDLVGAPYTTGSSVWYTPSQMLTMAKTIKALRDDVTQMMTLADSRSETIAKQTETIRKLREHSESLTNALAFPPSVSSDPVAAALAAEIEAAIKREEKEGRHPLREARDTVKLQKLRVDALTAALVDMTPDTFNILMGR